MAARAPRYRHSRDAKADRVICGVAEEVERVGLERLRSAGDTGDDLDAEHGAVDRKRNPQRAPPFRVVEIARLVGRAARAGHVSATSIESIRQPICTL
jgi:hypothetical protein